MDTKPPIPSCVLTDVKFIDDDTDDTHVQGNDCEDDQGEVKEDATCMAFAANDDDDDIKVIISRLKAEEGTSFVDGDDGDDGDLRAMNTLEMSFSGDTEGNEEDAEDGGDDDDDDGYECAFDEETQQKALQELREVPGERHQQVVLLRQWCRSEAGLKCPTDCKFLLTFLRARKFKQDEARSLLKRHLIMKTRMKGWYEDLDPCEPGIQAVLKEGFVYPLPKRGADGSLFLIFNYGKIEPWTGRYSKQDVLRAIVCVIYYLFFTDELNQVNGVSIVNDLSSMTFKHKTLFSIDEQKLFYGGWNKSIPARIKKICLYNAGSSLGDFVCMMLKVVTAEKLLQRVVNCGSSLARLSKVVPAENLPLEYLPAKHQASHGGTIAQNIERLLEKMSEDGVRKRIRHLSSPRYKIDLSKYSPSISQSLRKLII